METEDDEDYVSTEDDMVSMSPEEKLDTKYLAIFQNNSEEFDEQIISVENANELKQLEQSMMERTDKGYYRCKIRHETLYKECMRAYSKYITPEMLVMLQHVFSTQKNESLNHSVASNAPKGKDYSKSTSLLTRVMLTAATQIVGNLELWTRIFSKFNLIIDTNLVRHLKRKDQNKLKRQV